MGVDPRSGRFPICPQISRLSPFVSSFVPSSWPQEGPKRINGDKAGKEKEDDHDQDCQRKTSYTYGRGPLEMCS